MTCSASLSSVTETATSTSRVGRGSARAETAIPPTRANEMSARANAAQALRSATARAGAASDLVFRRRRRVPRLGVRLAICRPRSRSWRRTTVDAHGEAAVAASVLQARRAPGPSPRLWFASPYSQATAGRARTSSYSSKSGPRSSPPKSPPPSPPAKLLPPSLGPWSPPPSPPFGLSPGAPWPRHSR